jgi:hypothetical protein
MPTYLSYSAENTAVLDLLCSKLAAEKIEYLDPPLLRAQQTWMKAGESLREQLRDGIKRCACCVYVVTAESLKSDWCMIETAAFWGANKRIISYVTSASIDDSQLPPHLRGDYVTRRVEEVLTSVRDALKPSTLSTVVPEELVKDLSVDHLLRILTNTVWHPLRERSVQDRLLVIRGLLESPLGLPQGVESTAFRAILNTRLWDLVGVPPDEIRSLIGVIWPETFYLGAPNSLWTGFATSKAREGLTVKFNHCLLVRIDCEHCNSVAVVQSVMGNAKSASIEGLIDACGQPFPSTFDSLVDLAKSHAEGEI